MRPSIDFTGKRALVTGGSRGVGRSVVLMLAGAGADVLFNYHKNKAAADETCALGEELPGAVGAIQADFAEEQGADSLVAAIDLDWPDGFDFLVANAGIWPAEDVEIGSMSPQQWRQTLAVNLDGVFLVTRLAAPRLREQGRIVYVGSTAGQRGEAYHVDYAASKGALISMVKGLCVEFAPRGITVNCVAPGWIDTEMTAGVFARPGYRKSVEQAIPLQRVASPEDVAGPVIFLCTDLARHITGEILNVNGGAVLCG